MLGIAVTVALLWLLFAQISFGDVATLFTDVSLVWILVAFVTYVLSYVFRALRFKLILSTSLSMRRLFSIVGIHTFFNNVLPARTGELSYLYLIKKEDMSVAKGASSLIIARIFDFLSMGVILLLALVFLAEMPEVIAGSLGVITGVVAFVALLFVLLVVKNRSALLRGKKLYDAFGFGRWKIVQKIARFARDTLIGFAAVRSKKKLVGVGVATAGIWVMQYATLYFIILGAGIFIPLLFLVISITFRNLSTILPIQGIGGFGTIEGSWALGLILFGIEKDIAIATGFYNHLVVIVFYVLIGLYCMLEMRKKA